MIRALAVVTILATSATTASAGVYGSLGIGSTDASDGADRVTQDSRSGRLAVGMRFTYVSAEVGVIGYGVEANRTFEHFDGREVYAAGLVHYPIGDGFEAFGRLGVQHTSLGNDRDSFSGTGYLAGAGFEYEIKLRPLARAAVWVDYTRSGTSTLEDAQMAAVPNLGVSMWSLGITVGF